MAFIKVLLMLVGTYGFSYALFEFVTPKDSEIKKQLRHRPDLNNEAPFLESLRKAGLKQKSMNKEQKTAESSDTS